VSVRECWERCVDDGNDPVDLVGWGMRFWWAVGRDKQGGEGSRFDHSWD
jgi:hypothetical protein